MASINKNDTPTEVILNYMKDGFELMMERFDGVDQRFDKLEDEVEKIDQRLTKVENTVQKIDKRLERVEQKHDAFAIVAKDHEKRITTLELKPLA